MPTQTQCRRASLRSRTPFHVRPPPYPGPWVSSIHPGRAAFERAAVKAAGEAGLKMAKVGVEMITNDAWRAYLESLGYTKNVFASPMRWEKIFTVAAP
jgi:hypothetical protein